MTAEIVTRTYKGPSSEARARAANCLADLKIHVDVRKQATETIAQIIDYCQGHQVS